MASATVTYDFTGGAQGWTWTTQTGNPTGAYNNNRLQYDSEVGRNKTCEGYFSITGTFASIFGVDTTATITGYSAASFNGGCTSYTAMDDFFEGDTGTNGALYVDDGTIRTLIDDQATYTAAAQTHTPSVNPGISGLSLPGSTSITLFLHYHSDNANNPNAGVVGYVDDISITIEYNALITNQVLNVLVY